MRRRALLAMIALAAVLAPAGRAADREGRPWRAPRVVGGWVLAERDR